MKLYPTSLAVLLLSAACAPTGAVLPPDTPPRLLVHAEVMPARPEALAQAAFPCRLRSGERCRLRIQLEQSGYLYAVKYAPHGQSKQLFPPPESGSRDRKLAAGEVIELAENAETIVHEPGQAVDSRFYLVASAVPLAGALRDLLRLDCRRLNDGRGQEPAKGPADQSGTNDKSNKNKNADKPDSEGGNKDNTRAASPAPAKQPETAPSNERGDGLLDCSNPTAPGLFAEVTIRSVVIRYE